MLKYRVPHGSQRRSQNADKLGSLAGPSLLTVCVGVVEYASASTYTYSSSTHRFPDERTPIEATPLSVTSAKLVLGVGLCADTEPEQSSHTTRPVWRHDETWGSSKTTFYYDS